MQGRIAVLMGVVTVLLCTGALGQEPPPARVVVMKVFEKQLAPTRPMVGAVSFDTQSGLSAEISGLIESLSMEEGRLVRRGDVLVGLNTDFIKKEIEILKIQVEQVEVKIENARKNVARYESLYKKSATSEKAVEDLVDSMRELVKEKERLQKNIEKSALELAKSKIRAPFDGLILQRLKSEGEWVSPGTAVCTIAATDDMVVRIAAAEELIRFVQRGQKISLVINALDLNTTSTITTIVPVADPASKTFQIKIAIPYHDKLLQNMSATAHLPVGPSRKLKMIKRDALVRSQGKTFIYTVKENKAVLLPVHVVAYDGEYIGVDDPVIVPEMAVVIDGNERLRPDQAVQIVESGGGSQAD